MSAPKMGQLGSDPECLPSCRLIDRRQVGAKVCGKRLRINLDSQTRGRKGRQYICMKLMIIKLGIRRIH